MLSNLDLQDQHTFKGVKWYHEQDRSSKILIITAGDSWTWGDSLGKSRAGEYDDYEHRTRHIYGNIISERVGADFINVGLPGYGNLVILDRLVSVLDNLVKSYNHMYLIVTMTECGRDLLEPFVARQKQYDKIKSANWPDFYALVNGQGESDRIPKIYSDSHQHEPGQTTHMRDSLDIHLALKKEPITSLDQIFLASDEITLNKLSMIKRPNMTLRIGKAFTTWSDVHRSKDILNQIWTEIISNNGNLNPYPKQVPVMSGMGIDPLVNWINLMGLDLKSELSDLASRALSAISWLDRSPFNSKMATKHPLELAHEWWAEYILENLNIAK